ncbi:hypothetical protein [Leptolyngbya sp. FACHB-16]|uniref:hypothetical protein n=1 Tax=unclassified Leptolyngbya TaxID=2650499 RepID=UPI001686D77A|nr:hypothetical protein [Leptolyngbya sp. FACHB-16]MBD2156863.1 hypothetical protein [Leptolyngbya sp. FACHB-16]
MLMITHPQVQQDYFSPDADLQLAATNSVRQPQHNGLAARWVRLNGKLQCQWDIQ